MIIDEKTLSEIYPDKIVSGREAVSKIKQGSRVFLGSGCGEPQHLIHAMVKDPELQDIMIYQMLSFTLARYVGDPDFHKRFHLKLFFISRSIREAAFQGKIDYIPTYLSQIPKLFSSRRIGLDVALIQVSPPDNFGYCSLGVSVDITRSGMENAGMTIAQINPRMPKTGGNSFVHVDDIDYLVFYDEPLVESTPIKKENEISKRIGGYVSQLVDDGATIQIGFGHLPYAVLKYLDNKKDLGVHTQVITDAFLPLFTNKVITNKRKNYLRGRTVASLCMGSEKLYRYVNNNPGFYFRASDFVNDPTVIAKNDNLISISSALEVDLTGQVCTDSVGYLFYSGIGDQVDFIRGSAMSKGGFSIIALPSTAQNDNISRIVSHLSEGAGTATTRADVNFVVTEYGIAELQGKSIYQRVMELAQIAHPKFRAQLVEEAKKHHYIFPDQLPPLQHDLIFVEKYKDTYRLPNGKTVEFKPLFPSDEFEYRNFFYSLQEKTIYSRFFYRVKLFPHEVIQKHCASIDYKRNLSIIGKIQIRGGKEIIAIGSYTQETDNRAEVAFVVREDYQNLGIGSYLLKTLEKIARENNYSAFSASVLPENKAMQKIFLQHYPNAAVFNVNENEIRYLINFDNTPNDPECEKECKWEKLIF
jgi:acyl-CoA hydrolase/GNAT superfamily N-acetyltransferase